MVSAVLRRQRKVTYGLLFILLSLTSLQTLQAAQVHAHDRATRNESSEKIVTITKNGCAFFQELARVLANNNTSTNHEQIHNVCQVVACGARQIHFDDCVAVALCAQKIEGNEKLAALTSEFLADLVILESGLHGDNAVPTRFIQLSNICAGDLDTLAVNEIVCKSTPLEINCSINIPPGNTYSVGGVAVGGPTVVGDLDMNGNDILNVDELCVTGSVVTDCLEAKTTGTVQIKSNVCIDEGMTLSVDRIASKSGDITIDALSISGGGSSNVGKIIIDASADDAGVDSVGGDITLIASAGDAGDDSVGGDITLITSAGDASDISVGGTITLNVSSAGSLVGDANAGNITLNASSAGSLAGDANGGTITINASSAGSSVGDAIGGTVTINASAGFAAGSSSAGKISVISRDMDCGGQVCLDADTITFSAKSVMCMAPPFTCPSDSRVKSDVKIVDVDSALDKLLSLTVRTFKIIEDVATTATQDQQYMMGFFGQELINEFPDFVFSDTTLNLGGVEYTNFHLVKPTQFGAAAIAGIQALDKRFSDATRTTTFNAAVRIENDLDVFNGDIKMDGNVLHASDVRAKTDVADIDVRATLESVLKLKTKTYKFTPEFCGVPVEEQQVRRGLIAQDVEKLIPDVVYTTQAKRGELEVVLDDFKMIDYTNLVVDLIGALQAQHAEFVAAKKEHADFAAFATAQIEQLRREVDGLRKMQGVL